MSKSDSANDATDSSTARAAAAVVGDSGAGGHRDAVRAAADVGQRWCRSGDGALLQRLHHPQQCRRRGDLPGLRAAGVACVARFSIPFPDEGALGTGAVVRNARMVTALFPLMGAALVTIDRVLARLRR